MLAPSATHSGGAPDGLVRAKAPAGLAQGQHVVEVVDRFDSRINGARAVRAMETCLNHPRFEVRSRAWEGPNGNGSHQAGVRAAAGSRSSLRCPRVRINADPGFGGWAAATV